MTVGAQRMACLAGVRRSFAQADQLLAELAGRQLDEETIRRLCHKVAGQATATHTERATATRFAAAAGGRELQIDAGKVNTPDGWRDVQVAVFACRERGEPACAAEGEQRELPAPTVRAVVAALEEAGRFGERGAAEAERLNWTDPRALHVPADGGEWIWNLVGQRSPGAAQDLDIYHGAEHRAAAARSIFGAGNPESKSQGDRASLRLLEDGYWGAGEWVGEISGRIPAGGDGAAPGTMLNYFAGHQGRLGYALRRWRGPSIGSGLVEGSIKQLLNRRLKQTGARWKTAQVGPFVELHALAKGPDWNAYWNNCQNRVGHPTGTSIQRCFKSFAVAADEHLYGLLGYVRRNPLSCIIGSGSPSARFQGKTGGGKLMGSAAQTATVSKKLLWAGRITSALPVLMLLFSGVMKLVKPAPVVKGFTQLGYDESLALGLGILELACTALYVIPRTTVLGAILLTGYLGGAIATHVRVGDSFFVPIILGVLVWGGLYLRDGRLRALLPHQGE